MIRKRSPSAAKAIQASADDLPFDDNAFDASMAILLPGSLPLCGDQAFEAPRS
jgi:hypothetical protein